MTATPGYVCDSIVRTSLTAEEIVYSEKVVIARGHVLAGQTVVAPDHRHNGISISGKMSVEW